MEKNQLYNKLSDLVKNGSTKCEMDIYEFLDVMKHFNNNTDQFVYESVVNRFGKETCSDEVNETLQRHVKTEILRDLNYKQIREHLKTVNFGDIPAIRYSVDNILQRGDLMVSKLQAINALYETLYPLRNDVRFKPIIEFINETYSNYKNEIGILQILEANGDFVDEYAISKIGDKIYEFVSDEVDKKRAISLKDNLLNYTQSNKIKNIINVLNNYINENELIDSSDNFEVTDLISFSKFSLNKKKIFFANETNVFVYDLDENLVNTVPTSDYKDFEDMLSMNKFINHGKNYTNKDSVNIMMNGNHLKFMLDESKAILFNDEKIEENLVNFIEKRSLVDHIRNKSLILKIYENLDNLFHVDFAKNVRSKLEETSVTVFSFGDSYSIDFRNPLKNENRFLANTDANTLRQELKEFMNLEVDERLEGVIDEKIIQIKAQTSKMNDIEDTIQEYKDMINTIDVKMKNDEFEKYNVPEIQEMRNEIYEALLGLNEEVIQIKKKIERLKGQKTGQETHRTTKMSYSERYLGVNETEDQKMDKTIEQVPDANYVSAATIRIQDVKTGDRLFVKSANESGSVISVYSVANRVNIKLDSGKTVEVNITDLSVETTEESLNINTQVKLTNGDLGTITAINDPNNTVVILTKDGETLEISKDGEGTEFEILEY